MTADLFNCQNSQLTDIALIKETLQDTLADLQLKLINLTTEKLDEEHYVFMVVFGDGHLTPACLHPIEVRCHGHLYLSGRCCTR